MFTRELVEQVNSQMIAGHVSRPVPYDLRNYIENKTPQEISEALSRAWRENAGRDKKSPERKNNIELEAEELFGSMRDATPQESESVNRYIRSISQKTGINFYDLC